MPRLIEQGEHLNFGTEYLFVRVGDEFRYAPRPEHTKQDHANIALSAHLVTRSDRTEIGQAIMDGAGVVVRYADRGEIRSDIPDSGRVQLRNLISDRKPRSDEHDTLMLQIRQESAQKLANMWHTNITLHFYRESLGKTEEYTFSPSKK